MTDPLVGLLEESRQRGFLGPGPVEDHLHRARAFAVAVGRRWGDRTPQRVLDLGAGGGLPGLILAATCWPDARWTFLDAQQRRTTFLAEAVEQLGLDDRVAVRFGRAEEVARADGDRFGYDLVVSRSFGAPAVVAECAAPFLQVGGLLVVAEPPGSTGDRWPAPGLAEVGLGAMEIVAVADPSPAGFATFVQESPCPERYPRRVGVPTRRPLFS